MNDESDIIAANTTFYAAFAAGDFAAMTRLWADDDRMSCIHPGWPPLIGRTAVMDSWRDIVQNPSRPRITCAEPYAIIDGDSGRVLCIEIVDGAALAATNAFRRIDGAWRLVHHQSSPIAQIIRQPQEDASDPTRRLH
ncbi:nuclear transport factor 2 family protein [Bradyrhizobium sp.]|uniref:nuclear transport factor 2 family protein n=1 Tax=Bradyrhizobium sp. TaxID=376 RepID=UPI003C5493E6